MIAIDPARLGARERARLIASLRSENGAEPPLLASPERVPLAPMVVWSAIALGTLVWAASRVELFAPETSLWSDTLVLAAVAACAAALLAGVALAIARARAIARTPWPVGRFVHRFGIVLADVDAIEILEGRDLAELRIDLGPADRHGREIIVSAVAARSGVVTTVRAHGELSPSLEDVRGGRWQVLEGYRDAKAVVQSTGLPRRRARWLRTALIPIVAALGAAALTALWLVPQQAIASAEPSWNPLQRWAEIERTFPLPWIAPHAARAIDARQADIRASIERTFAEPFRTALLDWLARSEPGQAPAIALAIDCSIDRDERDQVIAWLADQARADAEVPFFRSGIAGPLDELLRTAIPPDATAPAAGAPLATLSITCSPRPRRVLDVRDAAVVWLATDVRWRLELPDQAPLVSTTTVEPPDDAATLARLPLDALPAQLAASALRDWERTTDHQIRRVVLRALTGTTPPD